jgi:hypothetical protein
MADFADKTQFPESNDVLLSGGQENVGDLPIYRQPGLIISKWLLSDAEVEEIIKTRCVYVGVKGLPTFLPISVYGQTPFNNLTPEQVQAEIDKDIELVNSRLKEADILERVSRHTTELQAVRLVEMTHSFLFQGAEYLKHHIISKRGETPSITLYQ